MLVGLDNRFLDVLMDGSLDGAQESSAHVDTTSAQGERRGKSLAVGEATRCDKRYFERLTRLAEKDEVCDIRLTYVAMRRVRTMLGT